PPFPAIVRPPAPVAELVDAPDSKSGDGNIVLVRVRPGAPYFRKAAFHGPRPARRRKETPPMNEEALNTAIRKFLRHVGVTSQQEIEKAVRDALASGKLKGDETVEAVMTLKIGQLGVTHEIKGDLNLE